MRVCYDPWMLPEGLKSMDRLDCLQGARAGLAAMLAVVMAAAVGVAAAQPQRAGLFSSETPAEPAVLRSFAIAPLDDITIRRREATIDFEMLATARVWADEPTGAPASRLTLNLFDDTVLTAVIERTAPTSSGYSLSGRIEGEEHGTMTLVLNGTVVAGSVRTPSGTYRIRSVGNRLYISEVDESRLPPAR